MSRIFLEKYNMIALKSSTGSIWERRENDKEELPQSEQRVCRQLVGKLLWIDGVHLRCAVSEASSNLGRASETDMKNIRGNLEVSESQSWRGDTGTVAVQFGNCEKDEVTDPF